MIKDKGYTPTTLYEWIDALQKIKSKYKHDIDVTFQVINHQAEEVKQAVHHMTFTTANAVTIIIEEL
jgi:hypothetical protein